MYLFNLISYTHEYKLVIDNELESMELPEMNTR